MNKCTERLYNGLVKENPTFVLMLGSMIDDMAVYIANLGKYNEGYLVGAWFTFPIDEEDVKEKIGLNEQYEEYAIHDTDNFPIAIGEYVSIEELNEMYEMIVI